ncbi:MAG TPA: hypothetical protein V6C69_03655 [Trichormus sp.]
MDRQLQLKPARVRQVPLAAAALASIIAVNTGIPCAFAADNIAVATTAGAKPNNGNEAPATVRPRFMVPADTTFMTPITSEPTANQQSNSTAASASASNSAPQNSANGATPASPSAPNVTATNSPQESTQQSVTNDGQKNSTTSAANDASNNNLLQGNVTQEGKKSPFLTGSVQAIPPGAQVDIIFTGNINSETSQKGDELFVKVARDVAGSDGVGVPGGWYMHGLVTETSGQKRGGRDGYIEMEFDKLISPDGEYQLPFHATVSTKDSLLKSVAKVAAIDTGYVAEGALGGAILSVQFTGITGAIATHGYSVAIGAGVGAAIGAFGAAKRKGKILSVYPGDTMPMITAEPISLPGFDKTQLLSGQKHESIKTLGITINKTAYRKDPSGDRRANLLVVDLTMNNKTSTEYKFRDLAVVSDLNQRYQPWIDQGFRALMEKSVAPHSEQEGVVTFEVGPKKRKYWLVLLDRVKATELKRVPLN